MRHVAAEFEVPAAHAPRGASAAEPTLEDAFLYTMSTKAAA